MYVIFNEKYRHVKILKIFYVFHYIGGGINSVHYKGSRGFQGNTGKHQVRGSFETSPKTRILNRKRFCSIVNVKS